MISMGLTELWKTSRDQLKDKHVQQIIAFAGDGRLLDGSTASLEFREFLSNIPSKMLADYANQCLQDSFKDSGMVLQDIVNQVGVRLGFKVEHGRYRGTSKVIGFDGLWRFPDGHAIVVEVKTTDAYRIGLNKIAEYRRQLIAQQSMSKEKSSSLIVVGRKDTGDLEAQIRGSRHAWDMRLISVDALLRLMFLKESLEEPETIRRIYEILIPREFTRLDAIVDILFSAAEEAKQDEVLELDEVSSDQIESEIKSTPKAFYEGCVARVEKVLNVTLVRRVRTGYSSSDGEIALTCSVSKEYNRGGRSLYWFAFHPRQKEFLEQAQEAYLALGCGSEVNVLLIPLDDLRLWLDDLGTTERNERMHWHIQIYHEDSQWLLGRKKGKGKLDVTKYALK